LKMDSKYRYIALVYDGLGTEHAYQDRDVVVTFKNDSQRNEEIRNPRTKVTLSSDRPVQSQAPKQKGQPKGTARLDR
jgi:hypothetical protein